MKAIAEIHKQKTQGLLALGPPPATLVHQDGAGLDVWLTGIYGGGCGTSGSHQMPSQCFTCCSDSGTLYPCNR